MAYVIDPGKEAGVYKLCESQNKAMAETFLARSIEYSFMGRRNDDLGLVPLFVDSLNHYTMKNLVQFAGKLRYDDVYIPAWDYTPPTPQDAANRYGKMLNEWNRTWKERDPFELTASIIWGLVWLQPFPDGNKRTARMTGYFALNRCFGKPMPGHNTILKQFEENPGEFYDALTFCHDTARRGAGVEGANTGKLQYILQKYTENQLWSASR